MTSYKIIQDSVHGSVRLDGPILSLMESPEVQRLHSIHQLGLAYLVYPGANHTRLEHSMGTYAVSRRICARLQLSREESQLVQSAALLHDVGHLPYSHTFEMVLHETFGIDHVELSRRLIRGEERVLSEHEYKTLGKTASLSETLAADGLDPREVASLLEPSQRTPAGQRTITRARGQTHFNSKRYLHQIVNGTVDSDQLDYLVRDAHYTGVAHGVIDLDRIVETMGVFNGDLVVEHNGLTAVEGMLVARALMFSSVYFHKTVRISELMLAKAVELLGKDEVAGMHRMTDATLLSHLNSMGGYFEEIATLIKYRRLFKKAYAVPASDVSKDAWDGVDALGPIRKRRSVEEDIARRAGVEPGHVVIDVPSHEIPVSEPRLALADVRILENGKVKLLPRLSPIAASLQSRRVHEWAVMVACPARERDRVARAADKILGF